MPREAPVITMTFDDIIFEHAEKGYDFMLRSMSM